MKIFGSISELVDLVYRKGSNTVTLKPNTAQAANVVVSLPNLSADDTSVTEAATQTLTNKSVSGDSNTLSNIAISSLKADSGNADAVILRAPTTGAVTSAKIVNANISDSAAIEDKKLANITLAGKVANSATTATPSNAVDTIVARNGSGGFSAGTISATFSGNLTGNVTGNVSGTAANITATSNSTLTSLPSLSLPGSQVSGNISGNAANVTGIVASTNGGTGINNAGTLTYGANNITLTTSGATSVTLPTSGTLATLSGTEVLSNKDISGGTASNTSRITLPSGIKSNLDNLTPKAGTLVYGTDTSKVYVSDGSVLKEIGSGSSGINYLTNWYDASNPIGTVSTVAPNGSIAISGSAPVATSAWYADSTSGAAAIASSSSTVLRGSNNYLTALSGTSTSGATFVQTAAFNIDGSDLGKPVTISFDLTGVTTADDWDIIVARYTVSGGVGTFAELIPVAGTASSMTGTPGAQLPTSTTQFKGFFIPSVTGTDVYALRFRRRAGSTQIRIDSLTVGPQSLAQGAIVTKTQSYTPTISNLGSGSVTAAKVMYERVGNMMHMSGYFQKDGTAGTGTSVITFSLPTGLTLDTSNISTTAAAAVNFGNYSNASTNAVGYVTQTSGAINFVTTSPADYVKGSSVGANSYHSWSAVIPITEWSSGTTTLADRAVEEYASNNGPTWNAASNTTNFTNNINGPQGSQLGGTLSQNSTKIVRFNTPILPTDLLVIETSQDRISWFPTPDVNTGVMPFTYAAGVGYGVGVSGARTGLASTDVLIVFGQYAYPGATYGGTGNAWGTANYWRVKKVSGGAAVGFPVSARNIVGDTSGTAVPTGMIGEVLTSNTSGTTISTSGTQSLSLTLTPGVWATYISATYNGSSSVTGLQMGISTSNSSFDSTNADAKMFLTGGSTAGFISGSIGPRIFTVSSGTTQPIYTWGVAGGTTATGVIMTFKAVRIA